MKWLHHITTNQSHNFFSNSNLFASTKYKKKKKKTTIALMIKS